MKKSTLVSLAILLIADFAFGEKIFFQVKGSYFYPSEESFKSIYGSGPIYGTGLGFKVWQGLSLIIEGEFYSKKGKTTLMDEETKIQIVPISAGLRYHFLQAGSIRPHLGLGLGYFQYKETNPIGEVSKGDIGFVVQAGLLLKVGKFFFFDVQGSYSACKVNPAGVEADLGGIKGGLGLGLTL